jgi:hypothetical protein
MDLLTYLEVQLLELCVLKASQDLKCKTSHQLSLLQFGRTPSHGYLLHMDKEHQLENLCHERFISPYN